MQIEKMEMILTHKIALDPCISQRVYFARASGVARKAYNWALVEWGRQYEAGLKPNVFSLSRELNAIKREQFPYMLEVTSHASKQAVKNLGYAFDRFFTKKGKYPRFKKKNRNRDSFRADTNPAVNSLSTVKVKAKRVKLPIIGWVRMREELRFDGRVLSATVSRTADRWFVSLQVETKHTAPERKTQTSVGVDLGVKTLATLSDGSDPIEGPKALKRYLKKLQKLSREHSRKKKGSSNQKKSAIKLAQLHARIANLRSDYLHKLTSDLTHRFTLIGIENLNVCSMMANRKLSRAISDIGMYEFRRQLEYKAKLYGAEIIIADRWFASSKLCSGCGWKNKKLTLADRTWTCTICNIEHDRDVNAAINLRNMAESSSASACGARSLSGLVMKQELTAMVSDIV